MFQALQIALDQGADVSVDRGGRHPLIFFNLRQHLRRQADVDVRHRRLKQPAGFPLVAIVAIGVQITHRNGIDVLALQHPDRGLDRFRVERGFDPPIGPQALTHAQPQVPWHQGLRTWQAQIVALGFEALAHFEHIAVALCGEQSNPRPFALKQGVGRHRHAMHDPFGLR